MGGGGRGNDSEVGTGQSTDVNVGVKAAAASAAGSAPLGTACSSTKARPKAVIAVTRAEADEGFLIAVTLPSSGVDDPTWAER